MELLDKKETKLGLDIRAYSGLIKDEVLTNKLNKRSSHLDYEGHEFIMCPQLGYIEEAFPNRAEPLKYNGDAFDYEDCALFCIGSYSTYNQFRSTLESFANKVGTTVFNSLIDFSDCEGVIGSVLCEELYNAFVFYEDGYEKYVTNLSDDEFFGSIFMRIYCRFKQAFKIGKDGGAVEFC